MLISPEKLLDHHLHLFLLLSIKLGLRDRSMLYPLPWFYGRFTGQGA